MQEKPIAFRFNRKLFLVVFLVVSTFLVFFNTFNNDFHLDDGNSIVSNPAIRKITPLLRYFTDISVLSSYAPNRQFRPFLPLSLSINYALDKYNPVGYHIFNLIFNSISSILIFFILIEIQKQVFPSEDATKQTNIAFVSAALFAVHPVSGITINYISNRDLVLMQMFLSASFLVYVRMRRTRETVLGYLFVLFMLACSILSKTNPVVMPLLIIIYEIFIMKAKITDPKTWARAASFAAIIILFFLYTKYCLRFLDVQHLVPTDRNSFLSYFPTQAKLHLFVYMTNFFFPFNIHLEPYVDRIKITDPFAAAGILFIAASVFVAVKLREKNPLIAFCILAYWIMMLPDSSFMPLHEWRVDYRPYPSSPYLYFLIFNVSHEYLKPRFFKALFVVFFVYLSFSSFFINRLWRTDYSLWSYSVKKGGNPIAYQNLAISCIDEYEKQKYLETSLSMSPYYLFPKINYAMFYTRMGAANKAIITMKSALELNPSNPLTHIWFSKTYEFLNMKKDALKEAQLAVKYDPRNLEYLYSAASLAQSQGEYALSLGYTIPVIKEDPNYGDIYFLHGFALQKTGRLDECISAYRTFIKTNPQNSQVWFNLGYALKDKGEYREAAECFDKVLGLKPDYDEARLHLLYCYDKLGEGLSADFEKLVLQNK